MIASSIFRFIQLGTCLICGSFRISSKGLCSFCEKYILKPDCEIQTNEIDGIKVISLIQWLPGESDAQSKWILSLKNAPPLKWQGLAQDFATKGIQTYSIKKNTYLISCPNKDLKRVHAQLWTQALSDVLQIPILNILEVGKVSNEKQNKLTRLERQNRSFRLIENITRSDAASYIFADDIVTTGATMKAAWHALGRPENFQVWCPVIRARLRNSKVLI